MKSNVFYNEIKHAGFPVAEAEFKKNGQTPLPKPPYLITLKAVDRSISANGKRVLPITSITLELYTDKTDVGSQSQLESWLIENRVKFTMKERFWIESENFYQTVYEVTLHE